MVKKIEKGKKKRQICIYWFRFHQLKIVFLIQKFVVPVQQPQQPTIEPQIEQLQQPQIEIEQQPKQPKQPQLLSEQQLPVTQFIPPPSISFMEHYDLPAGTGPPEVGTKFTKLHWPLHRISALSQEPLIGDYRLEENNVKFYQVENNGFAVPGCSCFVPLDKSHNVPSVQLLESPCYFLSPGTVLPDGLAIVYTKKMQTRYPLCSQNQHALHFNIFPTRSMTLPEYSNLIKGLNWMPCNIKESAYPDELVSKTDDINNLKALKSWAYISL